MSESRREFICRAEALAIGLAGLAPVLSACARYSVVYSDMAYGGDGQRLTVSRASLGDAPFALVEAPGLPFPVYLYRHDESHYSAVLTRCMHRGCQVEPVDGHLVCPCHGSEYDNSGAILKGPTELPLIQYPVTMDADNIYISLVAGEQERA